MALRPRENPVVASAVRNMLASRRRIRRVGPIPPPAAAERAYRVQIIKKLQIAKDIVRDILVAELPRIQREALDSVARRDAYGDDIKTGMRIIRLRYETEVGEEELRGIASEAARSTASFQGSQLNRRFKRVIGIDVDSMYPDARRDIEAFTADNVGLIESVSRQYFDDVQQVALRNLRAGRRFLEWSGELEKRFEISQSRAALIARDQTNKFNGELNRVRQTALGVKTYIWRSVGDPRVRETHQDFDGNTYAWSGQPKPPEGHPGQPINCRCSAEPDVLSVLTALEQRRFRAAA